MGRLRPVSPQSYDPVDPPEGWQPCPETQPRAPGRAGVQTSQLSSPGGGRGGEAAAQREVTSEMRVSPATRAQSPLLPAATSLRTGVAED